MDFVRGYAPTGRVELVAKEDALPIIGRLYDAALRHGGVERTDAMRDFAFSEPGTT